MRDPYERYHADLASADGMPEAPREPNTPAQPAPADAPPEPGE